MQHYGDNSKRLLPDSDPKVSRAEVFSYGTGDRAASVRIPTCTVANKCGYIEDRRPASNMDPYIVCSLITHSTLSDLPLKEGNVSEANK